MIHPILLCGGSGTRLWPLSRKSYPKQFAKLMGEESLFQASARRLSGAGFAAPMILTGDPFRFIVTEQLAAIEQAPQAILIEPEGRNTAPAVLAAALALEAKDPEALMLVAPSDHVIPDAAGFRATIEAAAPAAADGRLVTFGITPDRPETGYGYLELAGGADPAADSPQPLARFVEKPDAERAAEMLVAGNFLWNAGIFLFAAKTIVAAYEAHAPELLAGVRAALESAQTDLGFTRLAPEPWTALPDISIDYAIMEKADNLAVMPYGAGWSDLGGWDAVWLESGPDDAGNVTSEHATAIDCRDTLLRSETPELELVGIGLEDIMAVAMNDAVLVAHKSEAQRVKEAVSALKERGAKVVGVNPVRSGYNAIADEWVGITPGTDGLFILALVHELLKAGKVDLDYLIRYTNLHQLVIRDEGAADDGLFLRDGDGNILSWEREKGTTAISSDPTIAPALTGTFQALGRTVSPAFQLLAERVAAGMLAHDQGRLGDADIFRLHDLVGFRVLQHAILVDAAFMRERILADDGLVVLYREARDTAQHGGGTREVFGFHTGRIRQRVVADAQRHDNFFQRRIAGALAEAIDCTLHLAGPIGHGADGVGDREAEIVVAMRRPDHLVGIGDSLDQAAEQRAIFVRVGITDRVRNIDRGRAALDGDIDTFAQEVELGARCIFCAPLDIVDEVAGLADRPADSFQHGIRPHLQLVLHVYGAGGDESVDTRARSVVDGFAAARDVLLGRTGEAADDGVFRAAGDLADGGKVAFGRSGETGFDHVDTHVFHQCGEFEFFAMGHGGARRLLAVTQSGVEDTDMV